MSGFKPNQSMESSYNHYSDTDACDQVVDFSKRYPEYPEEACDPSPMNNPELSLSSVNSEETKQPSDANNHDEVKFFCTEDTPLMESSASSYWDLREVGGVDQNSGALITEEQTTAEHCFSSPHKFSVGTPGTVTENCINSNLVAEENQSFDETEKREPDKGDEYIIQETEASFTKSSSPLMFSRSSSVGSLNSFEQHSIVDDRSSVSAFSNLPSGMISPSEIPDSPFEIASPFISKSKNNEFLFPSNDKSEDPVLVDQTISNEEFPDEAFGDFEGNDLVKVYEDEGDCLSVSNLSALSIQANSTHVSISVIQGKNTLVSLTKKVTVNCSVTDGQADFTEKCQNSEISDKGDVLEQNCINTITSHPSDVSQSEKTQSVIETKYEDKGTSTSEDFNFGDTDYEQGLSSYTDVKMSTPLKNMRKEVPKYIAVEGYGVNTYVQQYKEDQLQSSSYSKDFSDDESDELLAECILSGRMACKDSSMFNDSKQSLNHSFQTSGSSLKESFDVPNCSFSDNDVSDDDDDDGILNECVLLGMPQKSNSMQIETEKSSVLEMSSHSNVITNELPISNSPNHQLKLLDEILSQEKQICPESGKENLNLVKTESVSNQRNFAKEEEFSTFNLISRSKDQLDDIKNDLAKSDDDSENEESDLLLQQIVQLGMPKIQSRSPRSQKETKLPITYPPNKDLGSRDNCPDGVSDGEDDDDDILNEIINAGKPNSKPKTNKSTYAESRPCQKSQNQKKLTAAEDRQLYLNKYYYGNIIPKASENSLIVVDDCTRVWRTEDTPILSPTASISDLSTLSFTEDKVCQESFLNNSRNSDCSSESEDDELLQQCIRQGMPGARRVAA